MPFFSHLACLLHVAPLLAISGIHLKRVAEEMSIVITCCANAALA